VIDIDLPGVDGLTAARGIYEQLPQVRMLILTSLGRPGTLRLLLHPWSTNGPRIPARTLAGRPLAFRDDRTHRADPVQPDVVRG
jgi:CheY-like chemotaxis protein